MDPFYILPFQVETELIKGINTHTKPLDEDWFHTTEVFTNYPYLKL